jgi:PTH1 family peptidyl-tRNA hydrolase
MADRWLVIGLGNPGPEYENTRHNIGQLVVDELSQGEKFSTHKSRMQICEIKHQGQALVLAKSRGYMNETGGPAKALSDFYKIEVSKIIVVHDELDLPFNSLRIKLGGGDNGHNGLKSLTSSYSTSDYYRIRMGIGRPQGQQDPADFVLRNFASTESAEVEILKTQGCEAVSALITKGLIETQNLYNS